MKFSKIKLVDVANGPGIRTSLYVSGCRNHCQGCFNPETWDFDHGEEFTKENEDKIIKQCSFHYMHGLALLGGDPFEPENAEVLLPFLKRFKNELPNKTIWAYSGYTYEYIKKNENLSKLLEYIDVLVDGLFIIKLKDINLQFRGSSNQRMILIKESDINNIILWEEEIEEFKVDYTPKEAGARLYKTIESAEKLLKTDSLHNIHYFERDESTPPKIGMGCGHDC